MGFFSSLGIFAGVTLTGIGSTLLLEETRDKSLEELSRERQQNFIHGRSISRAWFAVLTLRQVSPKSSCGMASFIDMVLRGVKTTS
jgi:hypothetical protein